MTSNPGARMAIVMKEGEQYQMCFANLMVWIRTALDNGSLLEGFV
jgi:hypothetical protein